MNKAKVIVIASFVLAFALVALLFVNASKKKKQPADTSAMMDVKGDFTFSDMVAVKGDKPADYSDTIKKIQPPANPVPAGEDLPIPAPAGNQDRAAAQSITTTVPATTVMPSTNKTPAAVKGKEIRATKPPPTAELNAPAGNPAQQIVQPAALPPKRNTTVNFDDEPGQPAPASPAATQPISIRAVILNSVKVETNSRVNLQVVSNFTGNGISIRRNTVLTGVVSLSATRMFIRVEGNQVGAADLLSAYNSDDGVEGIPINSDAGGNTKEAARSEAEGQASTAAGAADRTGIAAGAVRVLSEFGRSSSRAKVLIPAGQKLILKSK